ncbi:hypothetical protein NE237_024082 [Protea cynaroides]|uniref:Homeobox domain-containing protein n=1 Tax=Protea cynaroides TaxID=273540 RepID=A0A9Q0K6W8_9MAGN|nr:hypothetical protein NE237_024082 [Protea cynaroides]
MRYLFHGWGMKKEFWTNMFNQNAELLKIGISLFSYLARDKTSVLHFFVGSSSCQLQAGFRNPYLIPMDKSQVGIYIVPNADLTTKNDIIKCDGMCDRGFHQMCLDAPLLKEESKLSTIQVPSHCFFELVRLSEFLRENQFPDRATKEKLVKELGITLQQVSKWFEHARRSLCLS